MFRLLLLALLLAPTAAAQDSTSSRSQSSSDTSSALSVDVPELLVRGLVVQLDTLSARLNLRAQLPLLGRLMADVDADIGRLDLNVAHLGASAHVRLGLDSLVTSLLDGALGQGEGIARDLVRPGGVVSRQGDGSGGFLVRTVGPDGRLSRSHFDARGRRLSSQPDGDLRSAERIGERVLPDGRLERRVRDASGAEFTYTTDARGDRIEEARVAPGSSAE
jgi:hypothetical protein